MPISDLFDVRAAGDIEWSRWSREHDAEHPFPVYANGRANFGLHGYASYAVEEGNAITLTARGTSGELGFAFFRASSFTPIGRLLVLRPKSEADARFFTSYINGIIRFAQENTGVAQLTAPQVASYQVEVPPLPEQRAIASALSDVDALLSSLDCLIAKKRDLKQAAMQQLLTGQTRLPGFEEEWKLVEFGDIATIRNAKVVPSSMPAGTQCVELESIGQGCGRLLGSIETTGSSSKYSFKKSDVLFGRLRAYLRKYWLAQFDGICSTEIWPLIPRDQRLCASYLHLLVQTNGFVDAAGVSYGTHMPRSDWTVLAKFAVLLPPLPEQTAIAAVLSDMDAELATLEARRDKTRLLKQGMMQELLTGKTRLITPDPADA